MGLLFSCLELNKGWGVWRRCSDVLLSPSSVPSCSVSAAILPSWRDSLGLCRALLQAPWFGSLLGWKQPHWQNGRALIHSSSDCAFFHAKVIQKTQKKCTFMQGVCAWGFLAFFSEDRALFKVQAHKALGNNVFWAREGHRLELLWEFMPHSQLPKSYASSFPKHLQPNCSLQHSWIQWHKLLEVL